MYTLYLFILALAGGGLTVVFRRVKGVACLDVLAGWLLAGCIGLGGLYAFMGHAFIPAKVAESIGWPTSPFQWEIAMANLALGVLGVMCIWFRGRFRLATAISANVYLLGCAAGHVRQMITAGDFAVNNAGPILWVGDLAVPLLTLVLVVLVEVRTRPNAAA